MTKSAPGHPLPHINDGPAPGPWACNTPPAAAPELRPEHPGRCRAFPRPPRQEPFRARPAGGGGQARGHRWEAGPAAPGGGSVPAARRGAAAQPGAARLGAAGRRGGRMSSGRSGRSAVKMEAPFYPEEGLELLPDFAPLPGFGAAGGPAPEAAPGQKLLLGAAKKRDPPPAGPAPLPGPFALRPAARGSAAALRLLPPPAAPPPAAGPAEPAGGARAEAALGSAAELPLLKLPPAADLEQLLIQGGAGLSGGGAAAAAGGGGAAAAGPFLYRQPVTQEQEGFADGFVKALADLHKQNQLLSAPGPCCAARPGAADPPAVYTNLGGFDPAGPLSPSSTAFPAAAPPSLAFGAAAAGLGGGRRPLEEPQTVPEAPPAAGGEAGSAAPTPPSLSPLDAESQERLKAERKRLRNRIAASKCRRRKLERIARLEEKVKALKGQNAELAATANLLRAQVTQLQGRVRSHLSSGCHINAAGPPPAAAPRDAPPEPPAAAETGAC
ncbi:transcription factor JunD-like [Cuculus canorus]|uniref:transcription factor JunD-like n=1 Tax=Cuculus canorus TaxID=55661 RepID=UPI0023AB366D|nr:transcription factor JunD-like [Cuculus canorus]